MNAKNTPPKARSVPRWLTLLIVLGVPTVVAVAGSILGAHLVEMVIFSMLCLFSVALVYFYALG